MLSEGTIPERHNLELVQIALANEANYSDDHCFAFSYINLKLGKLTGMPVPGTWKYSNL